MRGLEEIQGLEVGTLIAGKYRVDRLLDKGAMGAVVAATHVELGELRAIKLLLPATAADPEMGRRFLREARIAARLKSEHAVRVHDVGRLDDGLPYMVMEFLAGRDLRSLRKQLGPLPVDEATLYVIQACDALAEAHALGLVHRDVKPANLFLTHTREGTPCIKVLDFGVSKVSEAATLGVAEMRTSTGQMLGTPHYMPPEQMRGERDVDARADIWAIGSVLYVLLTGRYPMHARSVQTVSLVLGGKYVPPLPSKVRRGLTPEIDPIIMKCLERDRDKRYVDVAELVLALRPFAPPAAQPLVERIQGILHGRPRDSLAGVRLSLESLDLAADSGAATAVAAAAAAVPASGPRAEGSPASGGPVSGGPVSGGPVSGDPTEPDPGARLRSVPPAAAAPAAGAGAAGPGAVADAAEPVDAMASEQSEAATVPDRSRLRPPLRDRSPQIEEPPDSATLVDPPSHSASWSAPPPRRWLSPVRVGLWLAAAAIAAIAALVVRGSAPPAPPPGGSSPPPGQGSSVSAAPP
ncbi:serine/threonine-protein kinase [Sorangium sp. So ce131]|uniref:serine/threonine-protein kinase n=1 Tax=Sorangium sp. So ce131 TaxID=3133282 RepID=UPI003F62F6C3